MFLPTIRVISRRLYRNPLLNLSRYTPITYHTMSTDPIKLLIQSFDTLSVSSIDTTTTPPTLTTPTGTITGTNTIATHLASQIPTFTSQTYTDTETAEISQWLTLTAASPIPESTLDALEQNLKFKTTLLGEKPSIADVVVYARVKELVRGWSDEQRTGEKGRRHITRWVDWVQNSKEMGLKVEEGEKVVIDQDKVLVKLKPEEVKKKEKKPAAGAAAVAGEKVKEATEKVVEGGKKVVDAAKAAVEKGQKTQKKEKKEKPKREPAPPKPEPLITPAQIDLRVGHILYCRPHPDADSLFVSVINMGDAADSPVVTKPSDIEAVLPADVLAANQPLPPCRTVCSGLNGLVPIEEMQGRKVIVVANLKPVKMRGIMSAAMVLAASPKPAADADPAAGHKKERVELVAPPAGVEAGEKVFFEGYEGTPEAQLNPKKKVWEQIQPGFATSEEDGTVLFDRVKAGWESEEGGKGKAKATNEGVSKLVVGNKGTCVAKTVLGGNVS